MVSLSTIIVAGIVSVIGGIIGGALYTVLSIIRAERKAKKDYKKGRIFEVKDNPKEKVEEVVPNEIKIPDTKIKEEPKPKEKPNYKEDFKKFQKANKELEKLKKEHEKGNLSYQELKEKFEYYQNQDYYKNILKDYGKN